MLLEKTNCVVFQATYTCGFVFISLKYSQPGKIATLFQVEPTGPEWTSGYFGSFLLKENLENVFNH